MRVYLSLIRLFICAPPNRLLYCLIPLFDGHPHCVTSPIDSRCGGGRAACGMLREGAASAALHGASPTAAYRSEDIERGAASLRGSPEAETAPWTALQAAAPLARMSWKTTWVAGGKSVAAAAPPPAQAPPPTAALVSPSPPPLPAAARPRPSGHTGSSACPAAAADPPASMVMVDARRAVHLPPSHRQRGSRPRQSRAVPVALHQPIRRHPLQPAQMEQPKGSSSTQVGSGPEPTVAERQRSSSSDGGSKRGCCPISAPPPSAGADVASHSGLDPERQAAFQRFKQQREQRAAAATLIQAHVRQAMA